MQVIHQAKYQTFICFVSWNAIICCVSLLVIIINWISFSFESKKAIYRLFSANTLAFHTQLIGSLHAGVQVHGMLLHSLVKLINYTCALTNCSDNKAYIFAVKKTCLKMSTCKSDLVWAFFKLKDWWLKRNRINRIFNYDKNAFVADLNVVVLSSTHFLRFKPCLLLSATLK